MARLVIKPLGDQDLTEHAAYIEADHPAAATRFLAEVRRLLDSLRQMPQLGVVYGFKNPRLQGIRMLPVPDFRNFLVFYRLLEDGIEIVRVLHGARNIGSVFDSEGT